MTSTIRIGDLDNLNHIYFLSVQLIILNLNENLSRFAALPYLPLHCTLTHHVISLVSITVVMETHCYIMFLTDYPAPTIHNSCSCNDPSDLNAMYYFSWSRLG